MSSLEDEYSFKLYLEPNLLEKVQDLIDLLPQPRHRDVLTLRYVEDLTEEEVAINLGITRQRVNQLVRESVKQIKRQLKEMK